MCLKLISKYLNDTCNSTATHIWVKPVAQPPSCLSHDWQHGQWLVIVLLTPLPLYSPHPTSFFFTFTYFFTSSPFFVFTSSFSVEPHFWPVCKNLILWNVLSVFFLNAFFIVVKNYHFIILYIVVNSLWTVSLIKTLFLLHLPLLFPFHLLFLLLLLHVLL